MAALLNLTPQQLQALLEGPASAPPPGVASQLIHPPNLRATGTAVQVVCLVLATLALCMRVYTKARIIRQVVIADYSIVLGWAVYVGYFVPSWLAGRTAAGVHQWDLRLKFLSPFLYQIHVGSIMYGVCIFFIKLSILLQYLQIFVPVKRMSTMYLASYALIWSNFVFYFVSTFVEIFACSPIRKAWEPLVAEGHCVNILALNVAASSINSASDVGILILPQISIWRLHMSVKRKLQVSVIFLIGIFACVASVVRLVYAVKLYTHTDLTYYSWLAGVWTHPEMASGVIVACLPVSPKFFQMVQNTRLFSHIGSSLQSLLRSASIGGRGSTGNESSSKHISPQKVFRYGKTGPRSYEMLSGRQVFDDGKAAQSSNGTVDASWGKEGSQPPRAYIMHTVDIDATSEQRRGPQDEHPDGEGRIWQGDSSYDRSVIV